jgi:hypothetical protein
MRRFAFLLVFLVASCSTPSSQTQFQQAKAYADSGIGAVLAASEAYLNGPPAPDPAVAAMVRTAMNDLVQLRQTLNGVAAPTQDWKADALQALAIMQQLNPIVAPFLGPAGPFLPLANAVVSAFIQSLPPPQNAPATPPAALQAKSLEYHGQ